MSLQRSGEPSILDGIPLREPGQNRQGVSRLFERTCFIQGHVDELIVVRQSSRDKVFAEQVGLEASEATATWVEPPEKIEKLIPDGERCAAQAWRAPDCRLGLLGKLSPTQQSEHCDGLLQRVEPCLAKPRSLKQAPPVGALVADRHVQQFTISIRGEPRKAARAARWMKSICPK